MKTNYKEVEREKAEQLIKNKGYIFNYSLAGKEYRGEKRDFILFDNEENLFKDIRKDAIEYFKKNNINWWGGKKPTGHVLSSQIACINHLFEIRNDKEAVLSILKNISEDFIDVEIINSDKFNPAYIQFESTSNNDYLHECIDGQKPTRGNNCTSIDALIYAVYKDGFKWLIPIEWKFTESYSNTDKSTEDGKDHEKGSQESGKIRLKRYTDLIKTSNQLKLKMNNYKSSVYFFEPFYQLMRQTLWAEQMIRNKDKEIIKADNFLHIHVIPEGNIQLLNKTYKCSGKKMEITWKENLIDPSKYIIITPKKLMSGINNKNYGKLLEYLSIRYWS